MYKKVSTDLNFIEREENIKKFLEENHIFKKSIDLKKDREMFTFYDGPPTANGKPHIGHVLTRVIKDIIPRYQAMKGKLVPRKAGWDTHGLPVELEVEKLLGLNGKEQIESYGLELFIERCKRSVWKYKEMWEDFSKTVGFWVDMDNPYVTYDNDFIESEWWALKIILEKGLLYKGHKIIPYCPRCETPLSSHEVSQGYKYIKEKSAIVRFKVKDEEAFFLAWTTTPWTLPSNVALCVNPNEAYVKVEAENTIYYLAEALCCTIFNSMYRVIDSYIGKDLEYKEYEPLFDFTNLNSKKGYYVTCADYVTLSDGTGIVHIAPAFGEDDAKIGKIYDLPFLQLVDSKGEMTSETLWAGIFCKDADKLILKDLEIKGLLYATSDFEHSYPYCWRCNTPLIYYSRESWFIKMTAVKDDLIKNNNTINWIPESIGKGRFGDWLENIQDWSISRDRYWGTPLNIWECSCGHQHSVGSIDELKSLSSNCPEDIELHRPYIDSVTFVCEKCGQEMHRVPEVIDCWFDSGAMPFAQHHYPFENKDLFNKQFPADFISEAVDQTRGWFYSLLAISTLLFNKAPYKNVIVMGHVQDEKGQKMSKSKGNVVDPFNALKTYGADAIRWYFYTNSASWLPNKFNIKAVIEGKRKFIGTLWNTYAFFVLYANIDNFNATEYRLKYDKLSIMDKWLLSKLNTMLKIVDQNLSKYKISETAKALQQFIDEMSNWYVRRSRKRFWVRDMPQDKINAYMILYTSLVTVSKAAAPMLPFITEEIYQNLVRSIDKSAPESIHICDFPEFKESMIDKKLEINMDSVLKIVTLGRSCRNTANIKNRQPIENIFIKSDFELSSFFINIIKDELNVKNVILINVSDVERFITYRIKPKLKILGPKFGKQLGLIIKTLESIDNIKKAMLEIKRKGSLVLNLHKEELTLLAEDLIIDIKNKEGYISETDNSITVILDINLSDNLLEEGFARELISKIQTMRKEAGFEVMDTINVYTLRNEKAAIIFDKFKEYIKAEVLAFDIILNELKGYEKEWNINGEIVLLAVEKR